ncbi:hypothetical protein FB451DRAFT_1168217 [Mycena latifolia]|nr:hypothetical protein FB451DRAFT_1168217 [Mycena latifolia]
MAGLPVSEASVMNIKQYFNAAIPGGPPKKSVGSAHSIIQLAPGIWAGTACGSPSSYPRHSHIYCGSRGGRAGAIGKRVEEATVHPKRARVDVEPEQWESKDDRRQGWKTILQVGGSSEQRCFQKKWNKPSAIHSASLGTILIGVWLIFTLGSESESTGIIFDSGYKEATDTTANSRTCCPVIAAQLSVQESPGKYHIPLKNL